MIIDNAKNVSNTKIYQRIRLLLYLIATGLLLILDFDWQQDYLSKTWLWIYLGIVFVVDQVTPIIRNRYYVYVSDEGTNLIFRYYSLRPLVFEKYAFEIPKNQFYSYKITKSWPNRVLLTVYERTNKGIAKYPPVCISLLTPIQHQTLLQTLSKYVQKT